MQRKLWVLQEVYRAVATIKFSVIIKNGDGFVRLKVGKIEVLQSYKHIHWELPN